MRQVNGMNEDGNTITIRKLNFDNFEKLIGRKVIEKLNKKETINLLFADVETTGLDRENDQIVELAIMEIQYNKITSKITAIGESYESLNDPGVQLKGEIIRATNIKDEDVKGKKINWDRVDKMFKRCDIVISHNAGFDRPFFDRYLEESRKKIWGCTLMQIDWKNKDQGHDAQNLMCLLRDHGCFSNAHRALDDVKSMVWLACQIDPLTNFPYIREVFLNIKKVNYWCKATGNTYSIKDDLKKNKYRWDGKHWKKKIIEEEIDIEQIFSENIGFNLELEKIPYQDNFKL